MTTFNDFGNPRVKALPKHLRQFVVDQNYPKYSPVDHAVWRYVMRQNYAYLKDTAYYPYIPGLKKAGLVIEKIPSLQEMNDALSKIGWGAVTVDGFIPPAAFMEYQAYKVLVIAAEIRTLGHIEYTPAPDIIHESAGHAPIIADKDYADYLSYIGSVGAKAMFSFKDFQLYETIRHLSILKEDPDANPIDIEKAEKDLEYQSNNLGEPSEMALLSRLHWWTVEYGLIGSLENPKIYGAGLLSSIGEAYSCMQPDVKKLPYNIDTVNYYYDITKPQPQLFVTPNFQNLIDVLEEFANTMSFRRGGIYGLTKAIDCYNTCTAQFSSGLQASGVIVEAPSHDGIQPYYVQISGESQLSFNDKQLEGHGKNYHKEGFGSPVGEIKGKGALEKMSQSELKDLGLFEGNNASLEFESGVKVAGKVEKLLFQEGVPILITFSSCTVAAPDGKKLFQPVWGMYDMAVGSTINSVFCGAADKEAYESIAYVAHEESYKPKYNERTKVLHQIYGEIRLFRNKESDVQNFAASFKTLKTDFPKDWLACLEILEVLEHEGIEAELAAEIRAYLEQLRDQHKDYKKLITDGLHLIYNKGIEAILE